MKLTAEETRRYNRHLILSDFGMQGQLRLKEASVLVVGAGGLGSPALLYLSAAGIGHIGIADFDTVDITNLQRQVLFTESDLGKHKAEAAAFRLRERNSLSRFTSIIQKLDSSNVLGILAGYDVVIDGTDNFPTRYLLNDACVLMNIPLVYGSILKFEGQLSVFNVGGNDTFTSNYRDVFPVPPDPASVPNCEEAGVLGVLPGIIGTLQANEVIKILTGTGDVLTDKLLIFDSLTLEQRIISYRNIQAREKIKGLVDYEEFCGNPQYKNESLTINPNNSMKEITVEELKSLKDSGADFQLVDVREPHEHEICDIGGELIPQGQIPASVDKISRDKQVVIHCRSGARSGNMVQWLEKNHGFTNLYNLKGGILAWAKDIDPEMPTY